MPIKILKKNEQNMLDINLDLISDFNIQFNSHTYNQQNPVINYEYEINLENFPLPILKRQNGKIYDEIIGY